MPTYSGPALAGASPVGPMTSKERVTAALTFRPTDRVPRMFNSFDAEFLHLWHERYGDPGPEAFSGSDLTIVPADETRLSTHAASPEIWVPAGVTT